MFWLGFQEMIQVKMLIICMKKILNNFLILILIFNLILFRVRKILNLRIYDGEDGKRWECSVMDKNYEILCVSQFTLYGVLKGNKPDFHQSMNASISKPFFDNFLQKLKDNYKPELIKGNITNMNC